MATQQDYDILAQLYLDARERLYRTITGDTGVGTKTYANTVLGQLDAELKKLKSASRSFVDTRIPKAYKRELDSLYAYFVKHKLLMKAPSAFASLHSDAIYTIAREMQYQLEDALITVGRQVTRYVERAQDEALRQLGLRETGIKMASGGTAGDMQRSLVQQLMEGGFMTVQYGAGANARQVPVDAYASMVARSTTREAGNTARINQLTANGYDLMKMTEHFPTCEVCAPLQGRVYSISGNDPRFPPLSRAFGQYKNIHPNCRHVATPWVESMRTPEELAEAIEQSNRPFDDTRSAKEVALYREQQDKNRRARETLYQYERYRTVLGDDAPKSLQAFARMKKQGGDRWDALRLDYGRRHSVQLSPERALPGAAEAIAEDAKFTNYFFSKTNAHGASKGVAFSSRLGYNGSNWEQMRDEMLRAAQLNPARHTKDTEFGQSYEVSMVLQGLKGTPMDVLTVWEIRTSTPPRLVTAYPNNRKE